MIRTNLSTRPFYNERTVHLALALIALIVLIVTVFNVTRTVSLSRRHTELNTRAERAEARAAELRVAADRIRRSIDAKELATISSAAREANAIIDRRVFSWTELFNRFEATLPADVRISSVRPSIEAEGAGKARGSVTIAMTVVARRVEDIDAFMESLEATGAFADVLSREEQLTEEGMLQAVLEGRYIPAAPAVAPAAFTER